MPGAVVHANALQMLINGDRIYNIDGWLYNLVAWIIIFLYLLMFNVLEKIRPFLLKLLVEILFLIVSVLLLIKLGAGLMECKVHINVGTILLYLAFLIEYKMFAFELYDYLEKQSLYRRLSGWYASVKSFFSKKANRKVKTEYMRVEIEIETEITKTDNDEA
jgi:transcriptional antiterminator Rof (Rho-off)